MPLIRQLVAGLSARRPEHDPKSVLVGFVVDKVAVGQVILRVLRISPVNIIPTLLQTHRHLQISLTRRTNGGNLDILKKNFFGNRGELYRKEHPQVFLREPRLCSAIIILLQYTKLNTFLLRLNFFRHWYKILKQIQL